MVALDADSTLKFALSRIFTTASKISSLSSTTRMVSRLPLVPDMISPVQVKIGVTNSRGVASRNYEGRFSGVDNEF